MERRLAAFLRESSQMYIYSNPITVGEAAAALRAVEIVDSSEGRELIRRLRGLTGRFETGLARIGVETIPGEHPVVPLMIRDTARTRELVDHLYESGVLATGLAYPVVPRGDEEIRTQVNADHTDQDIDIVLEALDRVRRLVTERAPGRPLVRETGLIDADLRLKRAYRMNAIMRHRAAWALACVAAGSACGAPGPLDYSAVFDGSGGRWIDLTHSFDSTTIYWPTDTAGFQLQVLAHGVGEGGYFYSSNAFSSAEHGGTHLDAPVHFAEGRLAAADIPLSALMGPAAVVDVSDRAHPDYQVGVDDLVGWEADHGPFPDGGVLLVRTGWGSRWPDRAAYLGTDLSGPEAIPDLHFPGISPEAAEWLVEGRGIVAVGIDTPSIDYGQSRDFMAHRILYAENLSGLENVAGLDALPPTGAFVIALPMKIEGGSGRPGQNSGIRAEMSVRPSQRTAAGRIPLPASRNDHPREPQMQNAEASLTDRRAFSALPLR